MNESPSEIDQVAESESPILKVVFNSDEIKGKSKTTHYCLLDTDTDTDTDDTDIGWGRASITLDKLEELIHTLNQNPKITTLDLSACDFSATVDQSNEGRFAKLIGQLQYVKRLDLGNFKPSTALFYSTFFNTLISNFSLCRLQGFNIADALKVYMSAHIIKNPDTEAKFEIAVLLFRNIIFACMGDQGVSVATEKKFDTLQGDSKSYVALLPRELMAMVAMEVKLTQNPITQLPQYQALMNMQQAITQLLNQSSKLSRSHDSLALVKSDKLRRYAIQMQLRYCRFLQPLLLKAKRNQDEVSKLDGSLTQQCLDKKNWLQKTRSLEAKQGELQLLTEEDESAIQKQYGTVDAYATYLEQQLDLAERHLKITNKNGNIEQGKQRLAALKEQCQRDIITSIDQGILVLQEHADVIADSTLTEHRGWFYYALDWLINGGLWILTFGISPMIVNWLTGYPWLYIPTRSESVARHFAAAVNDLITVNRQEADALKKDIPESDTSDEESSSQGSPQSDFPLKFELSFLKKTPNTEFILRYLGGILLALLVILSVALLLASFGITAFFFISVPILIAAAEYGAAGTALGLGIVCAIGCIPLCMSLYELRYEIIDGIPDFSNLGKQTKSDDYLVVAIDGNIDNSSRFKFERTKEDTARLNRGVKRGDPLAGLWGSLYVYGLSGTTKPAHENNDTEDIEALLRSGLGEESSSTFHSDSYGAN